jgi:hypothetical protein
MGIAGRWSRCRRWRWRRHCMPLMLREGRDGDHRAPEQGR